MFTFSPLDIGNFSAIITVGYELVKSIEPTLFTILPTSKTLACVKPPWNALFSCLYSSTVKVRLDINSLYFRRLKLFLCDFLPS